jgi:hypothetical protein
MKRTIVPVLLVLLSGSSAVWAQTSYPMITHASPVAIQRGQTAEVTVEGQMNFLGAYKVLVEGEGVSADVVKSEPPKAQPPQKPMVKSVKLKFTVGADALPGVREFRIVTSLGISSVGQIVVADDPVIAPPPGNNSVAKAAAITAPCVACGIIKAVEAVDYYKFKAEAGQTFTFEVFCARIQDKIHDLQKHADPMLTLLDANGKELAGNDDFYFADSMFGYRFEKSGEYYLAIRDAKYDGDPRWVYAILVTNKPYVSHVFPMSASPGQTLEVEPVGSAKAVAAKVKVSIPTTAEPGVRLQQLEIAGQKTNPVAMLISPLPQVLEQEPNDTPAQATRVPIPSCINGRIGKAGDLDHYVFTAKKGQAIRFEVKARRFGTDLMSGLDACLDILDSKGTVLATADDISTAIKDAALVFNAPADGDFVLRIRDLLNKGGDHYVYAIEAEPIAPDFTLRCDGDKAMIGPGSSMAWYVVATRLNGFAGPITVTVNGLPKGVVANPLVIPASMTQGLLVLTAAADAPADAANVQVFGAATTKDADGKENNLTRLATPNQEIYFPGGGRGRYDVRMHTVGVTDKSDIELVEVTPKEITLKPGQEVKIEVKLKRRPDFDGNVTLDVKLRHLGAVFGDPLPPGVTMEEGKSKTLLGKASEGHIVLKAVPNAAAVDKVPISVVANVSINFVVKIAYSSEPIWLTVGATGK